MKHFLFPSIAVAIIACSSGQNNNLQSNSSAIDTTASIISNDTTIEGSWQLQPVLASDTASGIIPKLNFNLTTKKFTGNTGCNNMSGSFEITGNNLSFSEQIILTKMDCQGYNEKAFVENLIKTNRFKIADGVLQLMDDQTILSKWIRKGDTNGSEKI